MAPGLPVPSHRVPGLNLCRPGLFTLVDGPRLKPSLRTSVARGVAVELDVALSLRSTVARDCTDAWALAAPNDEDLCRQRLERPAPRLALGQALAGVAHAALDLSDGLAGDLGHILAASGVGAEIDLAALPVAPALQPLADADRLECLLNGGDDYELLFTAPASARDHILRAGTASATPVQRIGCITAEAGLRLLGPDGRVRPMSARSYDHFA